MPQPLVLQQSIVAAACLYRTGIIYNVDMSTMVTTKWFLKGTIFAEFANSFKIHKDQWRIQGVGYWGCNPTKTIQIKFFCNNIVGYNVFWVCQ